MIYRVYEVQEVARMQRWYYDVEADSPDEAIELVRDGGDYEGEDGGCPCGCSEEGYGVSGWAVSPEDVSQDEEDAAWEQALKDFETNDIHATHDT